MRNFLDGAHLPFVELVYPFHHKLLLLALVEGALMGYFVELFEGEVGGDELDCELEEAPLSDSFHPSFRIYFYYLAEVLQFRVTIEVAKILQQIRQIILQFDLAFAKVLFGRLWFDIILLFSLEGEHL